MTRNYRLVLALNLALASLLNLGCAGEASESDADQAVVEPMLQQKVDAMVGAARPTVVKGEAGLRAHLPDLELAATELTAILGELRLAVGHRCDVDVSLDLQDASGARFPVTARVVFGEDAPDGQGAPSLRVEDPRGGVMILAAGGTGAAAQRGGDVEVVAGAPDQLIVALGGHAGQGNSALGSRHGGSGGDAHIDVPSPIVTSSRLALGGRGGDAYGAGPASFEGDGFSGSPAGEQLGSAEQGLDVGSNGINGVNYGIDVPPGALNSIHGGPGGKGLDTGGACGGPGASAKGGDGGHGGKGIPGGPVGGKGGHAGDGGSAEASCAGGDASRAGSAWARGGNGGQGGWGGPGSEKGGNGGDGGNGGPATATTACNKGWAGAYGGNGGNGGGGARASGEGGAAGKAGDAKASGPSANAIVGKDGVRGVSQP